MLDSIATTRTVIRTASVRSVVAECGLCAGVRQVNPGENCPACNPPVFVLRPDDFLTVTADDGSEVILF